VIAFFGKEEFMWLRLTDGKQYDLLECNQECNPETGEHTLVCVLSKDYEFAEVVEELKKDEIAEILSVMDESGFIFQSKEYNNAALVTNDIKTGKITIKFNNQKK